MIELVIFDCDGVLVDSEALACGIVAQVLAREGFPVTKADVIHQFAGVSDREMFPWMEQNHGRTISADLRQQIARTTMDALSHELEPIPGIHATLEAIPLPKCVASGSSAHRVELSLRCTGLLDFFTPHVFTSSEVERGKPAPDLFLLAAERLGVDPQNCAVIEDSRPGVQAAVAAGMPVLGFVGASHCGPDRADALREDGAAGVFDTMVELPQLLSRLDATG